MQIVIVGDTFPPVNSSGAVMLKDLASEFVKQGDVVTVIVPSDRLAIPVEESMQDGIRIISIKAFRTKDIGYIRRLLAEFFNSFVIWSRLKYFYSNFSLPVDLIIWYSPSIFWGPLVKRIKEKSKCKAYLILRDIFPDWAVDLGLFKKVSLALPFLNLVANYQYQQADIIGLQSVNNLQYFLDKNKRIKAKVEVLWNWASSESSKEKCVIRLSETQLSGKKIFVYAGNIGVAQGVETFWKIIKAFSNHPNVGFIFVGRGSEMLELEQKFAKAKIENVVFFPEIPHEQIEDLYAQCDAGIIVLDKRHKTHNIPGKFTSYMRSGLPVFGIVNSGNDMIELVNSCKLGYLGSSSEPCSLSKAAKHFLEESLADKNIHKRCIEFSDKYFDVHQAAIQIKLAFKQGDIRLLINEV